MKKRLKQPSDFWWKALFVLVAAGMAALVLSSTIYLLIDAKESIKLRIGTRDIAAPEMQMINNKNN